MSRLADRSQARRITLLARVLALIGVAGAGVLGVAELPVLGPRAHNSNLPPDAPEDDRPDDAPRHDTDAIVASLAVHLSPPPVDPPAPPDSGDSEGGVATAAGDPRYIGLIRLGSTPLAVLVSGEGQRTYRVGDTLQGGEITDITEPRVLWRVGGRTRELPLAPRNGPRVTQIAPAPPPTASIVDAAGEDQEQARLDRLRERQQEMERRRLEQRRGAEESGEGGP